jgi:hypothetical protein
MPYNALGMFKWNDVRLPVESLRPRAAGYYDPHLGVLAPLQL